MEIYNRIDKLRKEKGITWTYLNEKVKGYYRGRMTEFKKGKTTLSTEQLETIAELLGTSLDYLLGNTDDPAPPGATVNEVASPLPFQLTKESHELLTHFFSLTKAGQDELLHYARFLTSKQADAPMQAKSHLA